MMVLGRSSRARRELAPNGWMKHFWMMMVMGSLMAAIFMSLPESSMAANKNVGTSGAQFLMIGAGARPTAMGDAFVGIADDVNAVYYNPAGIAFINQPEMIAMHTQWIQDINYDFGAFAYPTDWGAFAVSAATLKVEEIQKRDSNEAYQGDFEAMDAAYAFTFARNMGPLMSLGLTARYFDQTIDSVSAGTWSGDVGILKKMGRYPFSVGMAIRHFGEEIKFRDESDPQPLTIDVGVGGSFLREKILLGINAIKTNDRDVHFGSGVEFRQDVGEKLRFSLRGGYNSTHTDADGASGVSLGGGFGFLQFDLDFAWVPYGDLGDTIRTSAHFRF